MGSPWAGRLCLAILIIQAVLFADGGITALGANIFNMAVVRVWFGWVITETLQRLFGGSKGRLPLAYWLGRDTQHALVLSGNRIQIDSDIQPLLKNGATLDQLGLPIDW